MKNSGETLNIISVLVRDEITLKMGLMADCALDPHYWISNEEIEGLYTPYLIQHFKVWLR